MQHISDSSDAYSVSYVDSNLKVEISKNEAQQYFKNAIIEQGDTHREIAEIKLIYALIQGGRFFTFVHPLSRIVDKYNM